jgi:simple sugar transport system substrate-binding protein
MIRWLACLAAFASLLPCGKLRAGEQLAALSVPLAPEDKKPGADEVPFTVGFVYVGTKDDFGYNQSHAEGAAQIAKMPGVTVIEAESVAETKDCEAAMESMINRQGAKLIFGTSFGYFPIMVELAKKYPHVTFLHPGGPLAEGDPPNIGSYFAYSDEAEFLCGIVSGLTTKSHKLGFIAAKPIPTVLRDINAFELGARSVNPRATLTVIFTGDWFDPVREADAVVNLADQGIDVVAGHVDSLKTIIATAEKRSMYSCGYHADQTPIGPRRYLTGARWNWGDLYVKFVNDSRAGKPVPRNMMGSFADGTVKLSPFGPAVTDDAKKAVATALDSMQQGRFQIFKGPLNDNTGKEVIPRGTTFDEQDGALWRMDYLVEGVIGNRP